MSAAPPRRASARPARAERAHAPQAGTRAQRTAGKGCSARANRQERALPSLRASTTRPAIAGRGRTAPLSCACAPTSRTPLPSSVWPARTSSRGQPAKVLAWSPALALLPTRPARLAAGRARARWGSTANPPTATRPPPPRRPQPPPRRRPQQQPSGGPPETRRDRSASALFMTLCVL